MEVSIKRTIFVDRLRKWTGPSTQRTILWIERVTDKWIDMGTKKMSCVTLVRHLILTT